MANKHRKKLTGVRNKVPQSARFGGGQDQPCNKTDDETTKGTRDHSRTGDAVPRDRQTDRDDATSDHDSHEEIEPVEIDTDGVEDQSDGDEQGRHDDNNHVLEDVAALLVLKVLLGADGALHSGRDFLVLGERCGVEGGDVSLVDVVENDGGGGENLSGSCSDHCHHYHDVNQEVTSHSHHPLRDGKSRHS